MMKALRTCREVAALISAREDRSLSFAERAVVRAHAFICTRCTRWEQQVRFMSRSMDAWRRYRD